MNIFYTSECPIQAANNLCYVHQNKMLLEGCQLLSTAHHILDGDKAIEGIYKKTHHNHPSAIWVRKCKENYIWLLKHTKELIRLYEGRSGKQHKSFKVLSRLNILPKNINSSIGFTEPPAVVSDKVKVLKFFDNTTVKYQTELSLKYKEWKTRDPLTNGKRKVKVEFTNNKVPHFINNECIR